MKCLRRRYAIMAKDQPIHRIQVAMSEPRHYFASQSPIDRTTADEAMPLLEEVLETLLKRSLEHLPFAA